MASGILGLTTVLIPVVFVVVLPFPWGGIVGLAIGLVFVLTTVAATFERANDDRRGRDQSP